MAARFSLKDHLFNAVTERQLAREYGAALPHFDAERFQRAALAGLYGRELMARLDWLADCLEDQLSHDFSEMADEVEAAMPAPLDPAKTDDDFGQFIHAVPGILAVRHGLERHRDRAMHLLYQATQRFSMEFYIRPFLNRWPEESLAELRLWAEDDNYHVRRLVSEGTRPRLPWATSVSLSPDQTLPLLDRLQGDPTRYVTRSVANHLNDLTRTFPDLVLERLGRWKTESLQNAGELGWMTRHALRTLIKKGDQRAMAALGFFGDVPVEASVSILTRRPRIGETLEFDCAVVSERDLPILVDYRNTLARPDARTAAKVFKLKQGHTGPGQPFSARKRHRIKEDATTFSWYPGRHRLILQVNGVDRAEATFDLT